MSPFKQHKLLGTVAAALILLGAVSCTTVQTSEPAEQNQSPALSDTETTKERSGEAEISDSEEITSNEQAPAVEDYVNESAYEEDSVGEKAIANRSYDRYTGADVYTIEFPSDMEIDARNVDTTGYISAVNYIVPERAQTLKCFENGEIKTEVNIVEATHNDRVALWKGEATYGDRELVEQDSWIAEGNRRTTRIWSSSEDITGCYSDSITTLIALSDTETLQVATYFSFGDRTPVNIIEAIHDSLKIL